MRTFFRATSSIVIAMMALLTVHHLSVAILGTGSTRYADLIAGEEAELRALTTEKLIEELKISAKEAERVANEDTEPRVDPKDDPIGDWSRRVERTYNKYTKRRDEIHSELSKRESIRHLFEKTAFWGVIGASCLLGALLIHRRGVNRCTDMRLIGIFHGGLSVLFWSAVPASATLNSLQTSLYAIAQAAISLLAIVMLWYALKPNGLVDRIE
jgi:hypothetical protein